LCCCKSGIASILFACSRQISNPVWHIDINLPTGFESYGSRFTYQKITEHFLKGKQEAKIKCENMVIEWLIEAGVLAEKPEFISDE